MKKHLLTFLGITASALTAGAVTTDRVTTDVSPAAEGCDLAIVNNLGPREIFGASNELKFGFVAQNLGTTPITQFKVTYSCDGGTPVTEEITEQELTSDGSPLYRYYDGTFALSDKDTHEITITLEADGDVNASNNSLTYTVTRKEHLTAPYAWDAEYGHQEIVLEDCNADVENNASFEIRYDPYDLGNRVEYHARGANKSAADDWFFLPPVYLEPGEYKLYYGCTTWNPEQCEVWTGSAQNAQSMTRKINKGDGTIVGWGSNETIIFEVKEAGVQVFGFHLVSPEGQFAALGDFRIDAYAPVPQDISVTDLHMDFPDYLCVDFPETLGGHFYTRAENKDEIAYGVKYVFRGGDVPVDTMVYDIRRGGEHHFTVHLDKACPGDQILSVNLEYPYDTNADNNRAELPVRVIGGKPVFSYDFEDGQIPADFKILCLDNGVMKDNPDNPTWYIGEYQNSDYEMEKAIFTTAIFTQKVKSDRWLILPQMTLPEAASELIWRAGFVRGEGAENDWDSPYEVLISETGTEPADFVKVGDYSADLHACFDHLKLDDYAGKQIYVAFRFNSDMPHHLFFDDIRHYVMAQSDLAIVKHLGPSEIYGTSSQVTTGFVVENRSKTPVKNFKVTYSCDGGTPITEEITGQNVQLGGEPLSWFLSEKLALSDKDTHEVTITLEADGDVNASNNSLTYTVTRKDHLNLPYVWDSANGSQEIVCEDVNAGVENNAGFTLGYEPYNKKHYVKYYNMVDDAADADDWCFLPPVQMEPGMYKLRYNYNSLQPELLEIWMGSDRNVKSMTEKLTAVDVEVVGMDGTDNLVFEVKEAGVKVIGFHLKTPASMMMQLDGFSMDAYDPNALDISLSDLKMDSPDFLCADFPVTLRGNFAIGLEDEEETANDVKFIIKAGDVPVDTLSDDLIVNCLYYFVPDLKQALPGDQILSVELDYPYDTNADNNRVELPVRIIGGQSQFSYDFEDGQIPAEFQMLCLDEGVMRENADNPAWYIAPYGSGKNSKKKNAIFTSSDFTQDVKSDRWLILPQMTLPDGASELIWKAGFLQGEGAPEYQWSTDYEVLISETGTAPADFVKAGDYRCNINQGNMDHLKLDDYAGKKVYVAFRFNNDMHHNLYLDDIRHYVMDQSDLALVDQTGTRTGYQLEEAECALVLKNNGPVPVKDFTVSCAVDGQNVGQYTFNDVNLTLEDGAVRYALPENLPVDGLGEHQVELTVSCDLDAVPMNNVLRYTLVNKQRAELPLDVDLDRAHQQIAFGSSESAAPRQVWDIVPDDEGRWRMATVDAGDAGSQRGDWFFLPPVWVEQGSYKLDFDLLLPDAEGTLSVNYGNERQPGAMTEALPLSHAYAVGDVLHQSGVIDVTEPRQLCIGFRVPADEIHPLIVDNINFYRYEDVTGIDQVNGASIALRLVGGQLISDVPFDLLQVIDLNGRIVASAAQTEQLSVAHLPAGVYVARLQVDGQMMTVKFVK